MAQSPGSRPRIPLEVHVRLAGTITVAATVPALLVFFLVHPTEALESAVVWFLLFPLTCAVASGVFTPKIRGRLPDAYPPEKSLQPLRNVGFTLGLAVAFYVIGFFVLFVSVVVDSLVYSFDAYSPLVASLFVVLAAFALVPIPSLHLRWKFRKATGEFAFEAKDRVVAAVLALFGGGFGMHKFYTGQRRDGVVYLLFCWTVVPWLLGFRAAYRYATMKPDEFARKLATAYGEPVPDETSESGPAETDNWTSEESNDSASDEPDDSPPREAEDAAPGGTDDPFSDETDEPRSDEADPPIFNDVGERISPETHDSSERTWPDESSASEETTADELERLWDLYQEGAITEAEYEQSKNELLEEL